MNAIFLLCKFYWPYFFVYSVDKPANTISVSAERKCCESTRTFGSVTCKYWHKEKNPGWLCTGNYVPAMVFLCPELGMFTFMCIYSSPLLFTVGYCDCEATGKESF